METNFELLKQYVETSGNCVNLGRHLKSSNPNLYTWILEKTEFLNVKTNVKDTERMYCILNDIWEIPKTPFGDFALFVSIFGGYSLKKYSYARNQKFKEKRKTVEERKMQREQERMNRDPLAEYVNKHKQKNHHLYGDEMVEGYDYVICPITQLRRMMIKSNYITNYLGMTVEEFDTKFPGIKKVCDKHKDNISKGVNEIDIETGLTKHKIGTQKARLTLLTPDENGVTGYMKLGQKTKNTHMNNIDERGRNGYKRQADIRLTTILPNGLTVDQNAHIKRHQTLLKNNMTGTGGASEQSKLFLKPILDFLRINNITFYFDMNEYAVCDCNTGKYYFWDLTVPSFNIAIEYQSKSWHADPTMSDEEWDKWCPPLGERKTAEEVLKYDYNKARVLYENRGFITYYVWEKTQKRDVEDILCLLKTMTMKS